MRKRTIWLVSVFSLVMALAAQPSAGQYKVVGEKGEMYFGHISYVDAQEAQNPPVVFRLGATTPETAVLNLPLGPGDAVQTPGAARCEIQFDNGTIIRLDTDTSLKIETILAPGLSSARRMSNLLLARGRIYVMHKKHRSMEIFQVITPRTAVKLGDSAVALIEMADDQSAVQVERGRVEVLYGKDEDHIAQKKVEAGERIIIGGDNIAQAGEYLPVSEFMSWNEKVNANFQTLHEGNVLPKPLQNLPPAVFEFAQKFGNLHGEWIWHDLYGYVWRPFLNDLRYPWGSWQPYFYGNWSNYNGQLFWVPGEPWGWVPYHLGLWMWDKKAGWVWMPGSLFAPAWVDWAFYSGHYFWRPFSLFDYYAGWETDPYLWGFWNQDMTLGRLVGSEDGQMPQTLPVRTVVTKDGLKKKSSPSLPVPKEMKSALRAAGDALKRGDAGVAATLRETLRRSVVVSKGEFGKPGWQGKAISVDRFLERPEFKGSGQRSFSAVPSELVARDALRRYENVRAADEVRSKIDGGRLNAPERTAPSDFRFGHERPDVRAQGPGRPGAAVAAGERISGTVPGGGRAPEFSGVRFRDWNPDVRTALRMGVDIDYSSRTNEVFSSRLGLRSREGGLRSRMGIPGGPSEGFSPDSGSSMGSTGAPASTSGQSGTSHSSGSSVSKGSLKDGSSGKQN